MPANQQQFEYSRENLKRLELSLSTDRLNPYLSASQGDMRYAIALYEWNTALSESFYSLLQGLEVSLRNSMHRALTDYFGRPDWYTVIPLHSDQKNAYTKAIEKLTRDNKDLSPKRVIPELTFGFWVALTGPRYAQTAWDKCLYKAFPRAPVGRKNVQKRLTKIRLLRNRVAHHECIIGKLSNGTPRDLTNDWNEIVEMIYWICPVTAKWIKGNNTFKERFAAKPQP
jgi:hypothetical protein